MVHPECFAFAGSDPALAFVPGFGFAP